jgi:PST family polysaccharide transporter
MGIGLLVGVWVARYLGPERFGILNFGIAFVALFSAVATLGLSGIVVRDLVQEPVKTSETLGTTFLLQTMGGITAFSLVFVTIGYLRPDDVLSRSVVSILGFALIFKGSDWVKYWFESRVHSKVTVWVESGIFLIVAATKVGMIVAEAPLVAFAWVILGQGVAVTIALLVLYGCTGGRLTDLKPRMSRAGRLLRESWPLILAGISVMIYMKMDQIMLGELLDDEAVGIYSAAVRISEVWYFIPMAVVASVFPGIVQARGRSPELYRHRLQQLHDLMVIVAVFVALPMTFLSDPVVKLLFGDAYAAAGPVLSVHVWASLFVFIGVASSQWYIIENRQILSFQRTVLGAFVNIGLNFLWIPTFGVAGAAYATLVSYAIAALFADLLQEETRHLFTIKVASLNVFRSVKRLRETWG